MITPSKKLLTAMAFCLAFSGIAQNEPAQHPTEHADKVETVNAKPSQSATGKCVVNVPDANFYNYLVAVGLDGGDGIIHCSDVANRTYLDVSNRNIASLQGIEAFTNLSVLYCQRNDLVSLDLSSNTHLARLYAGVNDLTSVNLPANNLLWLVDLNGNELSTIDFSSCTGIKRITAHSNNLTSINLTNCDLLEALSVQANQLTSLDLSGKQHLNSISAYNNTLTSIDLSSTISLLYCNLQYNTLTSVDFSGSPNLNNLNIYNNQLTTLDVSNNPQLGEIYAQHNLLTALDLSNNDNLTHLDVSNNALSELDLRTNNYYYPYYLKTTSNGDLFCIEVDDAAYSYSNYTNIDAQTGFSETDCNLTQLTAADCGKTVVAFDELIYADPVPGATAYTYEFYKVNSPYTTSSITKPQPYVALQNLNLYAIGATYEVRVKCTVNGNSTLYGSVCILHSPATVPTTQLDAPSCGKTLSSATDYFYAEEVAGATDYNFRFYDMSGTQVEDQYRDSYINNLDAATLPFGYDYDVEVRAMIDGTWGSFGGMCRIYATSPVPTTELNPIYCNITLTSASQVMSANIVSGADKYQWEFTDLGTNVVTTVPPRSNHFINLISAGLPLGPSYSIRVKARYPNGTWGVYGTACTVFTTTGGNLILNDGNENHNGLSDNALGDVNTSEVMAITPNNTNQTNVSINAFPNPTQGVMQLQLPIQEGVLEVRDITGKMIQRIDISSHQVVLDLSSHPAGTYYVVLHSSEQIIQTQIIKF